VKKVAGGTTTVYLFSGAKVIAEYVNGAAPSSPAREYIYTGAQLTATIEGATTKYHHADHLSVRLTTDTSGNVIAQQGHFPFGETWYSQTGATKWQFTSYERDSETGNDFAIARYYIPRLGRFSSPDPLAGSIANPQSLNRYAYVLNDPANLFDPLGLRPGQCVYVEREDRPPILVCPSRFELEWVACVLFGLCERAPKPPKDPPCKGPSCKEPREPSPKQEPTRQPLCVPTGLKDKGKLSFQVFGQSIEVSGSATLGPVTVSTTGEISLTFGVTPPWFGAGASVDINAVPRTESRGPEAQVFVGAGKNLSAGTTLTAEGPTGANLSIGPSVGPAVGVSLPLPLNLFDILVLAGLPPCK
jgi:RHS repeat-associated protein